MAPGSHETLLTIFQVQLSGNIEKKQNLPKVGSKEINLVSSILHICPRIAGLTKLFGDTGTLTP